MNTYKKLAYQTGVKLAEDDLHELHSAWLPGLLGAMPLSPFGGILGGYVAAPEGYRLRGAAGSALGQIAGNLAGSTLGLAATRSVPIGLLTALLGGGLGSALGYRLAVPSDVR